ncbi:Cytochrome c' [Oligella sp. MSHR50489EDL]|uniref:c-type cytochrome n=1 Tax=Oligella sp. MSHR50489EDL TaxID=3139409 RepID=UPI003D813A00
MKKLLSAVMLATCTLATSTALAVTPAEDHFETTDDAVQYRQAAFKLIGDVFGARLGAVARGDVDYDADAVKENAQTLKVLINLPWAGFADGREGGNAQDKIWGNKDDFNKKAQAAIDAVAELETASESGDLAKFKQAFAGVGQSCKSCHDSYRKR